MKSFNKNIKIVLTGPESTGKSTLTRLLAEKYNAPFVDEIARDYLNSLNRKYVYNDLVGIAKMQILAEKNLENKNSPIVFLDTDLIVTKIWFLHCYGKFPSFVDKHLKNNKNVYHLLCYYDLPWEPDPLRENPDIRDVLFEKYRFEIEKYSYPYGIVKGIGINREENALKIIQKYFLENNI